MKDYGAKVSVTLITGEKISGWVYADDPNRGLYLALDPEGKVIRFIPLGFGLLSSYDHDEPYPWFETSNKKWQLTLDLQNRVGDSLKEILSKVDYNRIRRLYIRFREIAHALNYKDLEYYQLLPHVLWVRNAYADLLDELKKNGMTDLLMRELDFIRSLLSEDTVPQFGLYQINWYEFTEAIRSIHESDYMSKTVMGENLLNILSEERLVEVIMDEKTKEELSEELEDPIRMS